MQDVIDDTTMNHDSPAPVQSNTEAEGILSAEIAALWSVQKNGKATVRRTRAELKALRLTLAEKLHAMKATLVRTGRGGGWASYLRSQKLPLATADRYVAEHEIRLSPPANNLLSGELVEPTEDDIRQLVLKLSPRLSRVLISQESVHNFVNELLSHLSAADYRTTEHGVEVLRSVAVGALSSHLEVSGLTFPAPAGS
jgi:hypothetical protein